MGFYVVAISVTTIFVADAKIYKLGPIGDRCFILLILIYQN